MNFIALICFSLIEASADIGYVLQEMVAEADRKGDGEVSQEDFARVIEKISLWHRVTDFICDYNEPHKETDELNCKYR